jgi:nucleoside-diphosphate-sugar epimerase
MSHGYTVLVTGGAGFLGARRHIRLQLEVLGVNSLDNYGTASVRFGIGGTV